MNNLIELCWLHNTHTLNDNKNRYKVIGFTFMLSSHTLLLSTPYFASSGQCRWPIYPSGAVGILFCACSWPCLALFLDWQCVVRSQPWSLRQGLLPQTHGPRLVLMPRFLWSPYAQPCLHFSTLAHTQNKCIKTQYWQEQYILTSCCSTLDQQKGSHTQSERGLWG